MTEHIRRRLDRDLPRIDMYSADFRARQARQAGKAAVPEAAALVDEARRAADAIRAAARAEAERILADAGLRVERILAKARAAARTILEAPDVSEPRLLVRDIIREVAERHHVRPQDITGSSRARPVVKARWAAIRAAHLARPDLSTPALGRLFGGRDHSSIIHALRRSGVRPAGEDG